MNEDRLTCPTCTFYMDMLLERSGKIVILEHNALSAQYMFSIQVDIIKRFKRVGRVRVKR